MIETCASCGLKDDEVEAQGMYYCPNPICSTSGATWFRMQMASYKPMKLDPPRRPPSLVWGLNENPNYTINLDELIAFSDWLLLGIPDGLMRDAVVKMRSYWMMKNNHP